MKHIILLLTVVAWLPFANAKKITAGCESTTKVLLPYVTQGMFSGNLLLAKQGQVLCEKSAGVSNDAQQNPIVVDSVFSIASLSKPIVASLLLRLQEEGKLSMSDTLGKHLPNFDAPWANKVTVHHLLSNRSGLSNHFALKGWGTGKYQKTLPHHELLSEIANMELTFSPGTQYRYSNLGWLLLGEIVEAVTQKSLGTNLDEFIFVPLGMSQSGLIYKSDQSLVSQFRWRQGGGWEATPSLNMQVFNVGGGLYSTSGDLLRYLAALHQGDLLSPASQSQVFSADSPYGWRIERFALSSGEEKTVHSFDGQLKGYSSFIYHVLEDNISVVLLTNTGMGFEHKRKLANDVLDSYYGQPIEDISSAASLVLNRSLLDNTWDQTLAKLKNSPLTDLDNAVLVNDLAKQLSWSGHEKKAIDLYQWLLISFPDNLGLKQRLKSVCKRHTKYVGCQINSGIAAGMQVVPL